VDRQRRYFVLMGTCLALIISAWFVVRFYSTTAAIVMSVVAMFIPPVAAIVGNRSDPKPRPPRRHRW
jgi:ABC-type transport system involved in cytochrome bd biosynthesis fused ATPase/permease subunit